MAHFHAQAHVKLCSALSIHSGEERMMAAKLKGKVQTVLGPIDPSELGIALTHEHLLLKFERAIQKPTYGPDCLADLEIKMENLGKIRQYPYSVRANLVVDNEEETIEELKLLKKAGGSTLCDVTNYGIRIKAEALPRISKESGVNIVAGTGFYVDPLIPEEVKRMSVREMADFMVEEIVGGGMGGSGVRCGLIGEVGCSWPLTGNEKRSLEAAALTQRETGAPLIIHPGRDERSPFEILDILEAAGADISRTVMSHLDRTFFDDKKLLEFARRGCYLEYDMFGIECSHYQWFPRRYQLDFPSDAQKIQKVKILVEAGYSHRILLAHDIHTKHRLVRYGGHGYGHVLEYVRPKMADRGISAETVTKILTENPRQWLTFV